MFSADWISAIMELFLEKDSIVCQPTVHGKSIIVKTVLPNIKTETKNIYILIFCSHVVFTDIFNRQTSMAIQQFAGKLHSSLSTLIVELHNSFEIFML